VRHLSATRGRTVTVNDKEEMRMSIPEKPLHIDITVRLSEIKVAFSVAALAFEGDLPASIFHLQLITKDIDAWPHAQKSS
jgi:hypothetical protein